MDANSSRTHSDTFEELRELQDKYELKENKIHELKVEINSIKLSMKGKMKENASVKMEKLKILGEKYDGVRAEYNAMLAEKKREIKK